MIILIIIAVSWILPLLQVGITVGLALDYLVHTSDHCFLSYDRHLMWALIAPMLCMVLLSLVLTCAVWISRHIILRRGQEVLGSRKLKHAFECSVGNCILQSLLIIPWLLHLLNVVTEAYQDSQLIEWIFLLLLGLTGVGYLILVVLFNPLFRARCGRARGTRKPTEISVLGSLSTWGLKSQSILTPKRKPMVGTYYKRPSGAVYLRGELSSPPSSEWRPIEETKHTSQIETPSRFTSTFMPPLKQVTGQVAVAITGHPKIPLASRASSAVASADRRTSETLSQDSDDSEFLSDDLTETRI